MSKDLTKTGSKFVGTTICYAFMQATGMVNDPLVTCPRHAACARLAREFARRIDSGASSLRAGAASGTPRRHMPWIAASLLSAFLLGCYELCTKHAVRDNAVLPVLFLSNVCGRPAAALLAVQAANPHLLPAGLLVDPLTFGQHVAQLLLKSVIVASSWLCTYFAVKHLPLSIASPIRAASPIGTLLGGLVLSRRASLGPADVGCGHHALLLRWLVPGGTRGGSAFFSATLGGLGHRRHRAQLRQRTLA